MRVDLQWNGNRYTAQLDKPIHISIPLDTDYSKQPNAFGAPPYTAEPFRSGDFVGSIEAGSPVNFFNIQINPHGNRTHTESVGHIASGHFPVSEVLSRSHFVATLITVYPTKKENGDLVITRHTLEALEPERAEALIIRTLPNNKDKRFTKYLGTNPPYFEASAIQWLHEHDYVHLLTDLPSVDREEDGGALESHKMFWQTQKKIRADRTITEMIFVGNDIEDGLYLLDIQIAPTMIDVSPSRPLIYKMINE